ITATFAMGGATGTVGMAMVTVTDATIVSIAVSPTNPSIAKGTTKQLTAMATFTDNSHQDISASATWASSSATVATVSSTGLATGGAKGTSYISASSGGQSGKTTLTVGDATLVSIAVTPASPSIAAGTGKQFTATGTYTDNSTQDLTT